MTKKEIYDQIVSLTSELHSTNVAEKLFSAVKEENQAKFDEAFEGFKKENPDLYQRIVAFGEAFNEMIETSATGQNWEIFGIEYVFDINTIDSLSLYVLTFFANIEDGDLFDIFTASFAKFIAAIADAANNNLADFIMGYNWQGFVGEDEKQYPTLYDLLVTVFQGKFEEESYEETE